MKPVPLRWLLLAATLSALGSLFADSENALIDESVEPPLALSPDFAEKNVPPAERGAVAEAFGPIAPAGRQPTGALSGRIVFMNGGHGWTFDPSAWRLLRGNVQQMNEDYGNVDQLNFFATYCFNAGAVVVPSDHSGNSETRWFSITMMRQLLSRGLGRIAIQRFLRQRRRCPLPFCESLRNRDSYGDVHAKYSRSGILSRLYMGAPWHRSR